MRVDMMIVVDMMRVVDMMIGVNMMIVRSYRTAVNTIGSHTHSLTSAAVVPQP